MYIVGFFSGVCDNFYPPPKMFNSTFVEEGGYEVNDQPNRPVIKETIRSVTCKQLSTIKNNENAISLDEQRLSTVIVSGAIKSVKKTNTGVSFLLTDSTGEVSCTFWPNSPADEEIALTINEGIFIKVIGSYKEYNNGIAVVTKNIHKISTADFIYHLISAQFERKMIMTSEHKIDKILSKVENDVLSLITENGSTTGVHIDTIVAMLRGEYEEEDIRKAVKSLSFNCRILLEGDGNYKKI